MDVSLRFQQEGLNELIAKTKELEEILKKINDSGIPTIKPTITPTNENDPLKEKEDLIRNATKAQQDAMREEAKYFASLMKNYNAEEQQIKKLIAFRDKYSRPLQKELSTNNIQRESDSLNIMNKTLGMTEEQQKKARVAALNLNYVLRDSPYFALDFAQGILAIGNNLNPMIDSMRALKSEANSANMSFLQMARQSLGSGGLLTLGLSLAVSLIQGLIFAFARSKKPVDDLSKSFKDAESTLKKYNDMQKEIQRSNLSDSIRKSAESVEYLKGQFEKLIQLEAGQYLEKVFNASLLDTFDGKVKSLAQSFQFFEKLGTFASMPNDIKLVTTGLISATGLLQELGLIAKTSGKNISEIFGEGVNNSVLEMIKSLDNGGAALLSLDENFKIAAKSSLIAEKNFYKATAGLDIDKLKGTALATALLGEENVKIASKLKGWDEFVEKVNRVGNAIIETEKKNKNSNIKPDPKIKADWTSLYEYIAEQGDKVFPKLSTVERDYLREMSKNIKTWGDEVNKVFGQTVVEFDKNTGAWVITNNQALQKIASGTVASQKGVSQQLKAESIASANELLRISTLQEEEIARRKRDINQQTAKSIEGILNNSINEQYGNYKAMFDDLGNIVSFDFKVKGGAEGFAKGFGTSAEEINKMGEALKNVGAEGIAFQSTMEIMGSATKQVIGMIVNDIVSAFENLGESIGQAIFGIQGLTENQLSMLENFRSSRDSVISSINSYADLSEQLQLTRGDFQQTEYGMQMTEEARNRLRDSMSPDDFERITNYINDTNTALEYQNKAYDESSKGIGDYAKGFLKALSTMAAQQAIFLYGMALASIWLRPDAAAGLATAATIMLGVAAASGAIAGAIPSSSAKSAPPERPEVLSNGKGSTAGKGDTMESKTEINVVINGDVDQQMYDKTIASLQRSADEYRRVRALA